MSWLVDKTKQHFTEACYAATARDGVCQLQDCTYTTKSSCKLLNHLVTCYVVYVVDCDNLPGCRDSLVKHTPEAVPQPERIN